MTQLSINRWNYSLTISTIQLLTRLLTQHLPYVLSDPFVPWFSSWLTRCLIDWNISLTICNLTKWFSYLAIHSLSQLLSQWFTCWSIIHSLSINPVINPYVECVIHLLTQWFSYWLNCTICNVHNDSCIKMMIQWFTCLIIYSVNYSANHSHAHSFVDSLSLAHSTVHSPVHSLPSVVHTYFCQVCFGYKPTTTIK